MFAFQMQRVRHGVGYQKCLGVAVAQQSLPLLQTFFVDGQCVVILASAAEQRSERKLRRLDEGEECSLIGFRPGFLCTLIVFLSITDSGVPFLSQRGLLSIVGSDRFDGLSQTHKLERKPSMRHELESTGKKPQVLQPAKPPAPSSNRSA